MRVKSVEANHTKSNSSGAAEGDAVAKTSNMDPASAALVAELRRRAKVVSTLFVTFAGGTKGQDFFILIKYLNYLHFATHFWHLAATCY